MHFYKNLGVVGIRPYHHVKKSAMSVRFSTMKTKLSASLRGQHAVRKNAWEEVEEKVKSERDIEDLLEDLGKVLEAADRLRKKK